MKLHAEQVLLTAVFCAAAGVVAQAQQPTVKFLPDSAQLAKLDVEGSILGFALRVPKDYEITTVKDPSPDIIRIAGLGPERKDTSRPTLMLTLIKPPAAEQKRFTLESAVSEYTNSLKERRSPFVISQVQSGEINGIQYKHAVWSGTMKSPKAGMKGEFYIARDRDLTIELVCQDTTPGADSTIPLMDACLRTVRKVSQKLYYSVQWPDHSQIWSMDPDGSHRVCLTPKSDTDYHPAVSPDGKTVAFTTHRSGVRSIWEMDSDGSNQRAITKDADAGQCAWSQAGDSLAFSSNRSGKYCIYTMRADGKDVKKVSDGPSDDWPTWGANDDIVYEAMDKNIWTIKAAQADGTGKPKTLTDGMSHARWPNVSADGGYILYTAYVDSSGRQSHINLMMSDGTMKTALTDGANSEREPSWTADGAQILFHSDRQGRYEVYVMEAELLKPRRLAEANMDTREVTTAGRAFVP